MLYKFSYETVVAKIDCHVFFWGGELLHIYKNIHQGNNEDMVTMAPPLPVKSTSLWPQKSVHYIFLATHKEQGLHARMQTSQITAGSY